ncbi:hypothetical protein N9D40_02720 [bacterium]|nr:hypothetical protein [bacterium]
MIRADVHIGEVARFRQFHSCEGPPQPNIFTILGVGDQARHVTRIDAEVPSLRAARSTRSNAALGTNAFSASVTVAPVFREVSRELSTSQ